MRLDRRLLRQKALEIHQARQDWSYWKPMSDDYVFIGLVGEDEFAHEFNLRVNLDVYARQCDGGTDFYLETTKGRYAVDVKTTEFRWDRMLVREEKLTAQFMLYVHAGFRRRTETADLLGWQWGSFIRDNYVARDTGRGVINYEVPRRDLRPMSELLAVAIIEQYIVL